MAVSCCFLLWTFFRKKIGNNPEIRQLLYSLLNYMNSETFKPCSELPKEDLNKLVDSEIHEVKSSSATSIY